MTVIKNLDGSFTVSDIIKGQYTYELYLGYSRREAKKLFKAKYK